MDELSRRSFVAMLSAAGILAASDASSGQAPPAAEPGLLNEDAVRAAERVFGLQFTDEERSQMLRPLRRALDAYADRRRVAPSNELPAATTFDPRRFAKDFRPPRSHFALSAQAPPPPPQDDASIAFAPLTHQSAWIRSGRLTSRRLTEIYLDRITRIDRTLESVITVTKDVALKQADEADAEIAAGKHRGPLHGLPYGAKDLFDTAGIPTTWGAMPYRTRVAAEDATVIRRLGDAGAVLIAKTALGALAYGDQWFGGRTRNPFNTKQGSSGSSAGSAAGVSAGLFSFALGTETYGSIVSPCMRCGATGLRPTFGRVGRGGAMALCWSLDKIGPICRSVEDAMVVLHAINGADDADPSSIDMPIDYDGDADASKLTVGYAPAMFEGRGAIGLDREALDHLRDAGVTLNPVEIPAIEGDLLIVLEVEAAAAFEALTLSDQDDELVWQDDAAWPNTFRASWFRPAIEFVQAQRLRTHVAKAFDSVMRDVDALISPSFAGDLLLRTNFTGHPCLTVRTGFRGNNRPHGATLWGRLFDEGTIARLGLELERRFDARDRRPSL